MNDKMLPEMRGEIADAVHKILMEYVPVVKRQKKSMDLLIGKAMGGFDDGVKRMWDEIKTPAPPRSEGT